MEYFLLIIVVCIILYVLGNIFPNGGPSGHLQDLEAKRDLESRSQIQDICDRLDLTEIGIDNFPIEYSSHWIPKRTGGRRKLHIPSDDLKNRQKTILHSILYKAKFHPFCYGFRKHKSIVDNARPHCNSAVVIKLDIKNFFPSITEKHVEAAFANLGWLPEPVKKLTRMCCYQGALPQGAPTSPAVSNLVLKNLDGRLSQLAARNYAIYTRYADDITFSLNEDKKSTIRALIKITQLELAEEGFLLNFKQGKIRVLRRHQHQEICGITVNTDKPTLSRKKRRLLRSVKHRLNNDIPATMTGEQLEGWENFKSMVDAEPEKSSVKQSIKQAAS